VVVTIFPKLVTHKGAMTHEEIKSLFSELKRLLSKMDVPAFRKTSVHWLSRNLGVRNSGHPDFEKAYEIVNKLKRAGIATEPE
jgi:hypothetical protein